MRDWIGKIKNHPAFISSMKYLKKTLGPHAREAEVFLKVQADKWNIHFDAWAQNKRIGFLVLCVMSLLLIWYVMFYSPMQSAYQSQQTKARSIQRSVDTLKREIGQLKKLSQSNPNITLEKEIKVLNAIKAKTDKKILSFAKDQLSAPETVQNIKNRLLQIEDIRLIRVATLAAARVTPRLLGATKVGLGDLPEIYEHEIELDIESNYFSNLDFLHGLEGSWLLYWDSVEYVVLNYPRAKVAIKVHVLSKSEGWDEE